MSTFCMLYAAMFDHVSLPAKLPFEKEEVGDLPKSSSSQKNENGELLALSIRAIKQSPGTPVSSTTKTRRHDIADILLKVALNTNNQ